MWTAPRTEPIRVIVVHTNEGPDGPSSAENLASYLRQPNIVGGYHKVVDCDSFVVLQPDNVQTAGAPHVNGDGLHICITGYSYQTDWSTAGEQAAINLMAQLVAQWCMTYGIPAGRLGWWDLYNGAKGIVGHVDVTNTYRLYAGDTTLDHTDPGPNFPWDHFLSLVNSYINPTPPAQPPPPPPKPRDAMQWFDNGKNNGHGAYVDVGGDILPHGGAVALYKDDGTPYTVTQDDRWGGVPYIKESTSNVPGYAGTAHPLNVNGRIGFGKDYLAGGGQWKPTVNYWFSAS